MDRNGLRQSYACWIAVIFAQRCCTESSLILGGAGAKLEDMAAAYTAFARHGKAGKLRLQPDDPRLNGLYCRRGLRGSSAWIMADEAQPLPDGALPRVAPLAWKTGTSYGYRDAWAIGVNAAMSLGSGLADRTARPLLVSLALPVPYRC